MSNSYSEKEHPSSIYTNFNTRYVIHLFSFTDTLFDGSQMKIIKLEFTIFWYETSFLMFKTSLLLFNFCLCVYIVASNRYTGTIQILGKKNRRSRLKYVVLIMFVNEWSTKLVYCMS